MWRVLLIMFIAMSMIPAGDTAGKLLTSVHGVHPVFVTWSRFLIGALAVLPFADLRILRHFRDWRIWARGLMLVLGITSIQYALKSAPVADVFAVFFVGPIFSYVLSAVFLREPASRPRSLLMLLGFLGVLLVVRPGIAMSPGLGFAFLAGLFYGAYLTGSRWLAPVASPLAMLFTQLLLGAIVLLPLGLITTPPLDLKITALTLLSGLFSMGGNLLLLIAYSRAPATMLAPYVYLQLVAATALGWLVFGDLPDFLTWAGLILIVGAGLASASLAARPRP